MMGEAVLNSEVTRRARQRHTQHKKETADAGAVNAKGNQFGQCCQGDNSPRPASL